MKKFMALLLACAMVLSLGVTAFAEAAAEDDVEFTTPVVPEEKVETYDKQDQLLARIPDEEVTQLDVSEADKLPEKEKAILLKAYADALAIPDTFVEYCFWLDAPEEYKVEELDWILMQFHCPGSGVRVFCNSKEVPVFYIGGDKYWAKLPEFGAVAIIIDKKNADGEDIDGGESKTEPEPIFSSVAPDGRHDYENPYTTRIAPMKKEFEICDKDDNVIKTVPYEMVIEIQITQLDRLTPEEQEIFLQAYEQARSIEDRVVKYFFWLDVPPEYIPENFAYGKFEFTCTGENVESFGNGEQFVVVPVGGEDYFAKVTTFGPVMVVSD